MKEVNTDRIQFKIASEFMLAIYEGRKVTLTPDKRRILERAGISFPQVFHSNKVMAEGQSPLVIIRKKDDTTNPLYLIKDANTEETGIPDMNDDQLVEIMDIKPLTAKQKKAALNLQAGTVSVYLNQEEMTCLDNKCLDDNGDHYITRGRYLKMLAKGSKVVDRSSQCLIEVAHEAAYQQGKICSSINQMSRKSNAEAKEGLISLETYNKFITILFKAEQKMDDLVNRIYVLSKIS